jgi:uncharacterized protein (DUF1697 family)
MARTARTESGLIRYVAFLRGINVGGNKLIKMEELRRVLTAARFKNVRTFIASGNVIFDAREQTSAVLAAKIEKQLLKAFGHEVAVVMLTLDTVKALVSRNPFKKDKPSADELFFVVLLASEPRPLPKLPMRSVTENFDVIAIRDGAAFIVAHRKKTGWFGFPNNYIEKELGVTATTRNWTSLVKLVAFAAMEPRR